MAGIENTLKSISDLDKVLCEAAPLIKSGVSIGSLAAIFKLVSDLSSLGSEITQVPPELKDLDVAEAGQLAGACYVCVRDVLAAFAK